MENTWSKFYTTHGRFYLEAHEDIKKFINIAKKHQVKKILDLGCGPGRHLVSLAQEGFKVSGIDLSPSAAQLAEKWLHEKGLEGDVIVGDFDDKIKDFQDEQFDAVIAVNTLEYGENHELEDDFKNILRLLKKDGLIFVVYRSKESNIKHPDAPLQLFDEQDLVTKLSKYFEIIEQKIDSQKNYVFFAKARK